MKKMLQRTIPWLGICVLGFQMPALGQQLWDGAANDLEWTNGVNWNCSAGGACVDRRPDEWDTCNFTGTAASQTTIYISETTGAARIQQRANGTGPRTLQIGTNNLEDVTLVMTGNGGGTPAYIAQQNTGTGRHLTFSGATNEHGAKLRLRLDSWGGTTKSIDVVSVNSSLFINCAVSGYGQFSKVGAGLLSLEGENTYYAPTTIAAGTIQIGDPNGLGFGGGGTTVSTGGALDLNGQSGINESLTLNGTGIGAAGALVNSSSSPAGIVGGALSSVTVTAGGSGYTSPPTVTLSGGGGSGAMAEALLGLTTPSITVDDGGSGYAAAPFVYFSGGGGSGAAATAEIDENGAVTNITVTAPGWGYTSAPTIEFIGASTTVAVATVNTTEFTVSGVQLTDAGTGYTSTPTVGFSGGGGSGATADANFISVTLGSDSSVGGSGDIAIASAITGGFGLKKVGSNSVALTAPNTYSGTTTVDAGTLAVNSPGSLSASSAVTVNTGGTLGGNGTIGGSVTVNAGGTLTAGASIGTLAIGGDLSLSGNLLIEVNKSVSPSNDMVTVTGTLNNAGTGTVTVMNLGPALAAGDSFKLFNKAVGNGAALSIVSSGGEVWTNKLEVDGSIEVVSAAPPPVPATNLTIAATGPASISLGAIGAANSAYDVYTATNITTPMTNWWLIGTTNSDGGGLIQFLDSQATNDQRFYRFGQSVP